MEQAADRTARLPRPRGRPTRARAGAPLTTTLGEVGTASSFSTPPRGRYVDFGDGVRRTCVRPALTEPALLPALASPRHSRRPRCPRHRHRRRYLAGNPTRRRRRESPKGSMGGTPSGPARGRRPAAPARRRAGGTPPLMPPGCRSPRRWPAAAPGIARRPPAAATRPGRDRIARLPRSHGSSATPPNPSPESGHSLKASAETSSTKAITADGDQRRARDRTDEIGVSLTNQTAPPLRWLQAC